MTPNQFLKLKEQLESLRSEASRIEGALGELIKRMESEFKIETMEKAKKMLEEMERESNEISQRLEKSTKEFDEKWKDKIGEN